jgi:hypothetical protein
MSTTATPLLGAGGRRTAPGADLRSTFARLAVEVQVQYPISWRPITDFHDLFRASNGAAAREVGFDVSLTTSIEKLR